MIKENFPHGSVPRPDLVRLFMPGGTIPQPEVVPPGARSPGNLFDMRSRKMGRDMILDSELEWLNAKRVDADPDVLWFCEHYPKKTVLVETRWKTTIFDMLICFRDYRFLLIEVKYKADSNPQPGTDIWWQLRAQELWSKKYDAPYEIRDEHRICRNELELKNIKKILGLLYVTPPEAVCLAVLQVLSKTESWPMREVIRQLAHYDEDDVIRSICTLILRGSIFVPLDSCEFNKAISLVRC